jgi:asparagine synthase (glutamine-hydrolysing)
MMANRMSEPVSTFSIGLTGEEDELPYARRVAEQYHTQHEEFRVTAEGLTLIPRLCASFGEPFADASAIPTYYVSKIARSRVKMVLTGDGGDEMFAGYVSYPRITGFVPVDESPGDILGSVIASLSAGARLSHPSASGGSARHSSGASTPDELGWALRTIMRRGRSFLRYALAPWYKRHDILMGCFTLAERRALLGRGTSLSGADYLVRRHPFVGADSLVTAAQYIDVKSYLPDGVLVKVDRMSMVNSLEVRSPLLDYRIAELAFSMPTAIKLSEPLRDGSSGKYVLKELGSRYLGRDYVYRPKRGFGIPLERWLREDNGSYVKDTLLSGSSPIHDHLSRDVVRRVAQAHLDGTRDHGSRLWSLLMLDGWLRHVHDGTPGFSGGAS